MPLLSRIRPEEFLQFLQGKGPEYYFRVSLRFTKILKNHEDFRSLVI